MPDDNDNETATAMTAGSRFARGIFTNGSIAKEEVLIRLPCDLALDGRDLPLSYEHNVSSSLLSSTRRTNVSPWLRVSQHSLSLGVKVGVNTIGSI